MAIHSHSPTSASFPAPRRKIQVTSPEDTNQYAELMNKEPPLDHFYCVMYFVRKNSHIKEIMLFLS